MFTLALCCAEFVPWYIECSGLPPEPAASPEQGDSEVSLAPSASNEPAPLAITISGGGTLGAYMGGELYYMGLARRLGHGGYEPYVFTGASAGAINAFISAMSTCAEIEPSPRESMFWKVWILQASSFVVDVRVRRIARFLNHG